jgi:hypothetical protein
MTTKVARPCRKCGAKAAKYQQRFGSEEWYWVECFNCPDESPGGFTPDDAIDNWNNLPGTWPADEMFAGATDDER